jgi:hypothetical protein
MTIIDSDKIEIKGVFKEYLNPFNYLKGECIKKKCIDPNIYKEFVKVAKFHNIKYTDNEDLVMQLTTHFECKYHTISCLLEKINNLSYDIGIDTSAILNQLKNIKPVGPFDSNEWFSNINIDSVLEQFEDLFKEKHFLHIYYHMKDFKKANSNSDDIKNLNKINFSEYYEKGTRCFGVVFNTDVSSGSGAHWFSLFGDFSKIPFTIEMFDSSGSDPLPEIQELMCKIKHEMLKYFFNKQSLKDNQENNNNLNSSSYIEIDCNEKKSINSNKIICLNATNIVNQKDNHSCGSYSLFYILCRLSGIECKIFEKNAIGDSLMHEFRKNLFAHNY